MSLFKPILEKIEEFIGVRSEDKPSFNINESGSDVLDKKDSKIEQNVSRNIQQKQEEYEEGSPKYEAMLKSVDQALNDGSAYNLLNAIREAEGKPQLSKQKSNNQMRKPE